nr:hypothetical protein [Candidatus Sigynarchaeota archaeon]
MQGGIIQGVLFPQTIVAIAGMESRVRLVNAGIVKIDIKSCPDCIEPLHMFADGNDLILTLLGKSYHPDADSMIFTIGKGESARDINVPVRTFTDKEFFVVFCLEANFHHGWDPSWLPQFYPEKVNGRPGTVVWKNAGKVGPDLFGSSYKYLYDDSEARQYGIQFTPLERILHEKHVPITWMIDKPVAEKMAPMIVKWHEKFGDTYALFPTSYFYDNIVNFNINKTVIDAKNLLQETSDGVIKAFMQSNYPMYANVAGIDPWIGAIGTNFVKAAIDLGLKGLWGMGWDQELNDTSVFHRGAPWDAYKPSKLQFRIPARENERFELFLFQWTLRDLVNALHLSPQGSTIFTTDLEDLRASGIMKQVNPHYFMELFFNYFKNMKYNDYFVFLIHQEDHSAHFEEGNQFLKKFLAMLAEENPPGVVFATLDEVAQWLAIKYPDNSVPSQVLDLDDPLEPSVRKIVKEKCMANIRQVYDPSDDSELQRILKEHFPPAKLPAHLCFFNRSMLFLGYKPHHLPMQMWDYRTREEWGVPEDGQYPMTVLPKITIVEENTANGYKLRLISTRYFSSLPWIVWDPVFKLNASVPKDIAFQTDHAIVFFINLQAGENVLDFSGMVS